MACLDDNTAVDFATGSMARAMTTKVEAHLATCRECRTLVAALAPVPGDQDSDVVTSPRAVARGKRHHAAALSPTEPRGSEPSRPLEPVVAVGDTIDRYVVLRRVGAGGMGVVYAAYDPQLDRKVALKLLRTGIGIGEGEAKARLVREAQAIAQLSHPNVVAVYDVGATREGDVYVAMEFVEGDTLTQWLHRWERPWRDTLDIFREAGRGLAAAHGSGLLHRDFKPDNVLVGSDSRVRVTDFGLARSLVTGHTDESAPHRMATGPLRVTLTATGAVMGTPRYMSPEQLRGQDVSAAADQFSFCVALYEALYGQHPISGDTAVKMVDDNARALPPPEGTGVPTWIWPLLQRGLDPQPQKRFPSMAALLVELMPPQPQPRRRTYIAMAAAAALVLGGAAAATVLAPKPADDGKKIDLLTAQVGNLQVALADAERDRNILIARVEEAQGDREKIGRLVDELVVKTQRIQELESELQEVAKKLPGPLPRPPKPRLREEGGVTLRQLNEGVNLQLERFAGCMREWDERSPGTAATVTIGFRIEPDGRVRDPSSTGLDDRIVPTCLSTAIKAIQFPLTERVTAVEVDVTYIEGQTRVATRRLGTEEASPRIDN
ncbi:MAG TPA: protein kinase [Kofleriaceae bacterium]|nr:protein kinase [Kofleriaceae bacterium]